MTLGLFISEAHAQTAAPATGAVAPAAAAGAPPSLEGALMQFMPLFLIFGVFYFLLIRPQQKRFEQHKAMVEGIRRGDKVVTGGGILGTVVRAEAGDDVTVEIADNVQIRVLKNTITQVNAKTEAVAANDEKKKN